MRERRGRLGRVTREVAEVVGGTLRRRQQGREPRVVVYDAAGHGRLLSADASGRAEVLETAARMLELVDEEQRARSADGAS